MQGRTAAWGSMCAAGCVGREACPWHFMQRSCVQRARIVDAREEEEMLMHIFEHSRTIHPECGAWLAGTQSQPAQEPAAH
eukprot:29717-Chlamydomonas_euryale.AAC.11